MLEAFKQFLSVETIAFVVLGYPMSYVEFFGTVLYLCSVWLISRRKVLTWPIGIVSVLLYMALFYQVRLYSDTLEQLYYLAASLYGWIVWNRSPTENGRISDVIYSDKKSLVLWIALTALVSITVGYLMSRAHLWQPNLVPEAAAFPYLDAVTTIMSFSAMWLMARKRIESWLYWIIVDIIGIGLYYTKGIKFVALLYVLLLGLAVNGFRMWRGAWHTKRGEI
jgi:nicotinamide mononucleotide transporter